MVDSYQRQVCRNLGFLNQDQQTQISKVAVGIAGCGGDGGQIAEALARVGYQHFILADPEKFEPENLNRQTASESGMGENKAQTIAKRILAINPAAKVTVHQDGITAENVDGFARDSDIIVDETEYTVPVIGIMIARAARKHGKVVVMGLNLGYGGVLTSFVPGKLTFERKLGLPENMSLQQLSDQLKSKSIPLWRWVPFLPQYGDIKVLADVQAGRMSAPSLVQGVLQCAAMTTAEVNKHVLGLPGTHVAPYSQWIDSYQGVHRKIRGGRFTYYWSLAKLVVRSQFHKG